MDNLPTVSRAATRERRVLAAALATFCWSLACYSPAQAAVIFTATATTPATVTLSDQIRGPSFFFGLYAVQVFGGCSQCLPATTPGGESLGTFGLSIVSGSFNYLSTNPADGTQSAIPAAGGYYEHFAGYGDVIIAPLFNGPSLLKGANNFFGFSVYAAPGSNTATFEFDLDSFADSDLLDLPSKPLYLDVTGTTASPVSITDLTPGANPDYLTFTAPLTIDFTVTLSDTPFVPDSVTPPTSDVPEPWSWTILAAGLVGLLGLRRRGSRGMSVRHVAVRLCYRPFKRRMADDQWLRECGASTSNDV